MSSKRSMIDGDSDRKSVSYPDIPAITLTHSEMPTTHAILLETGMTYGTMVAPFISDESFNKKESNKNCCSANKIPRCTHCTAYINPFTDASSQRWFCALCGHRNNFNRTSQKRYSYSDMRLLPEVKDTLVDCRMPLIEATASNNGVLSRPIDALSSSVRPLVHVFLIQESMRLDVMQAVVESLSTTLPTMHPDIQMVLLTYSNRIGIYNFSSTTAVPSVQYVHFTARGKSDSSSSSSVLEGKEMHEIDAENYRVQLMMPLAAVADFRHTANRLGNCCDSYISALSSLFDAYPSETAFSNNDTLLPKNMLGPALEAVTDWILDSPFSQTQPGATLSGEYGADEIDSDDDEGGVEGGESTVQSGIAQIFGKLGLGGGWFGDAAVKGFGDRGSDGANVSSDDQADLMNPSNRHNAPIDLCNGVILHLVFDKLQDLRSGAHDSVAEATEHGKSPDIAGHKVPSSLSPKSFPLHGEWTHQLASRCAEKSLTVNLWPVTSFENEDLGLCSMQCLAGLTGGSLQRVMLGYYPKDERERLTEMLRRSLNAQYATRCLLKMRASPIVEFVDGGESGLMRGDSKLPGVYRLASCTPETTCGFEFTYKHNQALDTAGNSMPTVCFQLAFSYETLVESDVAVESANEKLSSAALRDMGLYAEGHEGGDASVDMDVGEDISVSASMDGYVNSVLNVLELSNLSQLTNSEIGSDSSKIPGSKSSSRKHTSRGYRSPSVMNSFNSETTRASPYNRRRKLVAVKYLRIITVMTECTDKPTRMFTVTHVPTMMALLVRKAIAIHMKQFSQTSSQQNIIQAVKPTTSSGMGDKLSMNNHGVKTLMTAVIKFLVHFTKCTLDTTTNKKQRMTYAEMLSHPGIDDLLHEFLNRDPLASDLATRIFSAIDLLERLLHDINSSGGGQSHAFTISDELIEFSHRVLELDCFNLHRILYPRLIPLNSADLLLSSHSIPLSKQAMMVNAGDCKYFVLDSGLELILYKCIQGTQQSSASATASGDKENSTSVDIMACLHTLSLRGNQNEEQQLRTVEKDVTTGSLSGAVVECKDGKGDFASEASRILRVSSQRSMFIANFLRRRLACGQYVPRIYLCAAGTQSASFFTSHLIEDRSRSGTIEIQQFKQLVVDIIKANTN